MHASRWLLLTLLVLLVSSSHAQHDIHTDSDTDQHVLSGDIAAADASCDGNTATAACDAPPEIQSQADEQTTEAAAHEQQQQQHEHEPASGSSEADAAPAASMSTHTADSSSSPSVSDTSTDAHVYTHDGTHETAPAAETEASAASEATTTQVTGTYEQQQHEEQRQQAQAQQIQEEQQRQQQQQQQQSASSQPVAEQHTSTPSTTSSTVPSAAAATAAQQAPPAQKAKKPRRKKHAAVAGVDATPPSTAASAAASIPSTLIPTARLVTLFTQQAWDELTHALLGNIVYLYHHTEMYVTYGDATAAQSNTHGVIQTPHHARIHRARLNAHMQTITWLLAQPQYQIAYKQAERVFIMAWHTTSTATSTATAATTQHHPYHLMLTTLVALCDVRDTTAALHSHDFQWSSDATSTSTTPLQAPPPALSNLLFLYNPYIDATHLTLTPPLFYSINWLLASLWWLSYTRHVLMLPIMTHTRTAQHMQQMLRDIDVRQWNIQQYVYDADVLYHYQTRTHTLAAADVYVAVGYVGVDRAAKQGIHALFRDVMTRSIQQLDMTPLYVKPTGTSTSAWTTYMASTAHADAAGWYRYSMALVVHAWAREAHVFEMYAVLIQSVLMHFQGTYMYVHVCHASYDAYAVLRVMRVMPRIP